MKLIFLFLLYLISLISINSINSIDNKIKKYFVYNWTESLNDLWPNLLTSTTDLKITSKLNYGVGKILNSTIGMFDTFQYGSFKLFHQRSLIDYRRTMNPDEAILFFIPYDSAFDAIMSPKGKIRTPGCPRALKAIQLLSESPYFRRSYGHDHFVYHAVNQALGSMNNRGECLRFLTFVCENCTKLTLDTYPEAGLSPNFRSVPFPSNIHWNTNMNVIPWNNVYPQRKFAISFTGSKMSYSRRARIIREKIATECELFPDYCHSNLMLSHSSADSPPNWMIPLESTFCMMPPGDVVTRKSFFDSILMGCIPVVFHRQSAHEQWFTHFGTELALATTIYFPYQTFLDDNNHTLMNYLIRLHLENDEVIMKRKIISKHASKLQYRLPEGDYQNEPFTYEKFDPKTNTIKKLSPPIDAFDVIINSLLNDPLLSNITDLINNPRDRGDYAGKDHFPSYPLGRTRQNLTHSEIPNLLLH